MSVSDIVKKAKVLNWIEIVVTVVMFVAFKWFRMSAGKNPTQEELDSIIRSENILLLVTGIISLVVIIMTAVLMKNNQKRVAGLGLLLASGIVTLIFSLLGITLGLIIWILSGASLSKLKNTNLESNFQTDFQ